MGRIAMSMLVAALLAVLTAPAAQADFGLSEMQVSFEDPEGTPVIQAGAHPFAMRTTFEVNTVEDEEGGLYVDGALRDLEVSQPEGFAGTPTPGPRCSTLDFLTLGFDVEGKDFANCSDSTAVGYIVTTLGTQGVPEVLQPIPVYNLLPPPGAAARLGFWVQTVPVTLEVGLSPEPPHNVIARLSEASQAVEVFGSELVLWGVPADPRHDELRGHCLGATGPTGEACAAGVPEEPFITLPRSCEGPLSTAFFATPWWVGDPLDPQPGAAFEGAAVSPAMSNCAALGFEPVIGAQTTSDRVSAPTGLEFSLDITDPNLTNPSEDAAAHSDIKRAEVTLPEGVTINPSQAEGLEVCSEAQLARESADSAFGSGCPAASKVGTVEAETPLLEDKVLRGQLFVAEPHANPFDSLLALYMVIADPELGISVKLAGRVEPDAETGQIRATFGEPGHELPQVPLSAVRVRLREGGRSPLVTPNRCGSFAVTARFTPWARPAEELPVSTSFSIDEGVDGGPCPSGGTPPFEPGFSAGSLNPVAAQHTPFAMRLTRRDGDQDLVRFDATLPRGVTARLAGVPYCPEGAIAAARSKSGRDELASPSCPTASQIGTVRAGAGVGSQLTYVPGSIYLAGPFAGAPLSVVAVVPAVAGPFDVGTVVVRQALRLDPVSAEVLVDGASSEPLPHILAGIPLRVRDIQVSVDRPQFTLNPTSCAPMQTLAEIWGGGSNAFSGLDDSPIDRAARFQVAGCARLGFRPRLGLRLRGGVRRGAHPALRAVYAPRPGEQANLRRMALTFPRSEFVENANFRSICTRVQFAAGACPKAAIYGRAVAFSPLLEEPLRGPVYLRSSDNLLPDAVFDLHGIVDFEVAVRIDSVKGRLRATVQSAPDVPVSRVVVAMQGARKGLFVNSTNICRRPFRATVRTVAHNGRRKILRPKLRPLACKEKGKRRKGKRAKRSSHSRERGR